jgi:hypothetical protein
MLSCDSIKKRDIVLVTLVCDWPACTGLENRQLHEHSRYIVAMRAMLLNHKNSPKHVEIWPAIIFLPSSCVQPDPDLVLVLNT